MRPIYLDYNATTPVAPEVAEAMRPYLLEHFGNPSSGHSYGVSAHDAVGKAREQVAAMLNAKPGEILFTSGGTESNNLALKGVVAAQTARGNHVITSAVEHPAIAEVCRWLSENGLRVTVLPVNAHARVNPADLEAVIDDATVLVSIMHANNEVGTMQPVADLAKIAHRHGALMHTDAAQSVGKVQVDVAELDVDLLTIAGHKLYAPKGIGALYVRGGVTLARQLHGAGHERGLRPGTENVPGIVGLGEAARIATRDLPELTAELAAKRRQLYDGLVNELGVRRVRQNGHPKACLPNTLSAAFKGRKADELLERMADTVAASAGSACHAGEITLSPVLRAAGVPEEWAAGTIRFSVGRYTTADEIDRASEAIVAAMRESPEERMGGTST